MVAIPPSMLHFQVNTVQVQAVHYPQEFLQPTTGMNQKYRDKKAHLRGRYQVNYNKTGSKSQNL